MITYIALIAFFCHQYANEPAAGLPAIPDSLQRRERVLLVGQIRSSTEKAPYPIGLHSDKHPYWCIILVMGIINRVAGLFQMHQTLKNPFNNTPFPVP